MTVRELQNELAAINPEVTIKVDSFEFTEVYLSIEVCDEDDAVYLRVSDEEVE